ncbi:DUF1425 domain-containing protein [Engelhardtia mirabilis]|uniref:DUF1425 domain-containing protein n=1 Tax=Engelhardtia mirabilis TaxID=2528011 RepID=A0A518BFP0_9BACT|nr:hypothetical protein Pla133_08420 [Planctomycetes bacterium Pla133]QDV00102.1 hypothetical protein Pla86_08410 [Planctomycetes bacterium Pla86]
MKISLPRVPALAALGVALALTTGCITSGGPLNTYVVTEGFHEVQRDVGNRSLAGAVSVKDVISERRQDRLFVQARITNESGRPHMLEWSVEWYDGAGILVGEPTAWKSLRLGGGEVETIRQTGPTPAATSMRLSVRPRDPVN